MEDLEKETGAHLSRKCLRVMAISLVLISLGLPGHDGFSLQTRQNVERPAGSSLDLQEESEREHALSWLDEGSRALKRSDSRQAIENYEKALAAFREIHDRTNEAITLQNLGTAYSSLSQYAKAIGFHERVLAIAREVGNRAVEGSALNGIASAWQAQSQYARAITYYEQALTIAREVHDRTGEGAALNNLGVATCSLGHCAAAIGYYEQALSIARERGDGNEATTLVNIGFAYASLGQQAKAINFYERALVIQRKAGYLAGEGNTLGALALSYGSLGQNMKAIELYEQALAIKRKLFDLAGEGVTLNGLAETYIVLSEYVKAISYYEQALAIARQVRDRAGEGAALSNLGDALFFLGQTEKGITFLQQALAIVREIHSRAGEGRILLSLGQVYVSRGDLAKAIELYEQALTIMREIHRRAGEGAALSCLATAHNSMRHYGLAIRLYEQALAIEREVGNRTDQGTTLNGLAAAHYGSGQLAKAVDIFEQALVIEREVGERATEAATLNNLMQVLASDQKPELAVLFGKQAVNIHQQLRQGLASLDRDTRKRYVGANEAAYRNLVDLLLARSRIAEAEQVLNLLKEDEFFDFVRGDSTQTSSLSGRADLTSAEDAWVRQYNEIAERMTDLGHERGELLAIQNRTEEQEKRLNSLDRDLIIAGKVFRKFLADLATEASRQKLSQERLKEVKDSEALMGTLRELGSGTVAIYTLVTEDKLRLILVTPDVTTTAETIIKLADLNTRIVAFRQSLENPQSDPRPLAREMYRLILAPIEKDLAGAKADTLMWSLDGALRYLPVAALHDGSHYLVERFRNVVFTPASNANLKDVPAAQWRALGLGVSKAHPGFGALPGAQKELEGIIQDDSPGSHGVLPGAIELDKAFTQESITTLRRRYRVVHIASHFRFKPGNETHSFLLLGDGNHMSLADVGEMVNPFEGVDLLTLSACDTASGGIGENGAEVEGFGVLAQRKGAKAVIATLWPVADASTNELMQSFYRMRESKAGIAKVEALRQAQLALLQAPGGSYSHPYYWAPFILIGNSR